MAEKHSNVNYISFSRNFGKESALYAGLKNAKGDLVCVMDVDLQDPPSLLPQMIDDIGDYDVVATRRVTRKGEPVIRSFLARMFYQFINRISKIELVDGARDYRVMTRQVVNALLELNEYNRFSKGHVLVIIIIFIIIAVFLSATFFLNQTQTVKVDNVEFEIPADYVSEPLRTDVNYDGNIKSSAMGWSNKDNYIEIGVTRTPGKGIDSQKVAADGRKSNESGSF